MMYSGSSISGSPPKLGRIGDAALTVMERTAVSANPSQPATPVCRRLYENLVNKLPNNITS
jgi:hypothetical protein